MFKGKHAARSSEPNHPSAKQAHHYDQNDREFKRGFQMQSPAKCPELIGTSVCLVVLVH
jgi:hypothetical protein